jgi:hypothetical protein
MDIAQNILDDVDDMLQCAINEYQETEVKLATIATRRDALFRMKSKVQQRIAEARQSETLKAHC